jgi:hypothetical protein
MPTASGAAHAPARSSRAAPSGAEPSVQKQQRVHQAVLLRQQWDEVRAFSETVLRRDAWRYDPAEYLPRPVDQI